MRRLLLLAVVFATCFAGSRGALAEAPAPPATEGGGSSTIFGLTPGRFAARIGVDAAFGAAAGMIAGDTLLTAVAGAAALTAIDVVQAAAEGYIVEHLAHSFDTVDARSRAALRPARLTLVSTDLAEPESGVSAASLRTRLLMTGHESRERILGLTPMRFTVRLSLAVLLGGIAGLAAGETAVSAAGGALLVAALDFVQIAAEAGLVGAGRTGNILPADDAGSGRTGSGNTMPIASLR